VIFAGAFRNKDRQGGYLARNPSFVVNVKTHLKKKVTWHDAKKVWSLSHRASTIGPC
jgi:hypothetical protein